MNRSSQTVLLTDYDGSSELRPPQPGCGISRYKEPGPDRDIPTLKQQYLRNLDGVDTAEGGLRKVVIGLIRRGIAREMLVVWGIQAGYSEKYVRSLLSRLLVGIKRERGPGAGRRTPPEALALLAYAEERFGEGVQANRFLLSAFRAGKAKAEAKQNSKELIVLHNKEQD